MEQIKNDPASILTRDTYYQLIHELWRALPAPLSDHPDDIACRDNAAMARIASMLPADPFEAGLACQVVSASAHAMDCLRLVVEHADDIKLSMKCRAQAVSMMRQASWAQSRLARLQDARRTRAALGLVPGEPVWSDHGILDRIKEALRRAPERPAGVGGAGTPHQAAAPVEAVSPAPVEEPAVEAPAAPIVSPVGTISEIRTTETPARRDSPAARNGDRPDQGPVQAAASWPPPGPDARPAGMKPASFAPPDQPVPALEPVIGAMHRMPHPAGPMAEARAA